MNINDDVNNKIDLPPVEIEKLENWIAFYLATLDDKDKDDWYNTEKGFASGELSRFIKFLRQHNA